MKSIKIISSVFLSLILITPLILLAAPNNGVAQRVAALEAAVETLTTALHAANTQIANLQTEVAEIQNNSVLDLDGILTFGPDSSGYPRALFTGVNVQIINGLGATNGYPDDTDTDDPSLTQVNGLGNLIIGYNEGLTNSPTRNREGSHNITMGRDNSYSSYGGLVTGKLNTIKGPSAVVFDGRNNTANEGVILGGRANTANGGVIIASYITDSTGGFQSAIISSMECSTSGILIGARECISGNGIVIGGARNSANSGGIVVGGERNIANGTYSVITGGQYNTTNAFLSSISGGEENTTEGFASSILGGFRQSTTSNYETIPAIP